MEEYRDMDYILEEIQVVDPVFFERYLRDLDEDVLVKDIFDKKFLNGKYDVHYNTEDELFQFMIYSTESARVEGARGDLSDSKMIIILSFLEFLISELGGDEYLELDF